MLVTRPEHEDGPRDALPEEVMDAPDCIAMRQGGTHWPGVSVATFDNRNQAYDAAFDFNRLSDDTVDVEGGAILEEDLLGNVTTLDTRNVGSAWGTVGAAGGPLI